MAEQGSDLSVSDVLAPRGLIARRLHHYESRPQQLAMAEAVASAIAQKRHLIAEAATGVGKSFAYLVPAILAATQNQGDESSSVPNRIIVSTHTISLQEQLLTKDIPLLNSIIPREFSAVLVKGRRNYLSLRRLENALKRMGSLAVRSEELEQFSKIRSWAKTTHDGSLADLDITPSPDVWDEVASDHGNCLGKKCPHHSECFYFIARRRIQHAQILVVNHALFFSDLALRRSGVQILPNYRTVILDEAHTIESIAGEHLGISISSGQLSYALNKLFNDSTNKGLLVHHHCSELQKLTLSCHLLADEFFLAIYEWMQQQSHSSTAESSNSMTVRVRRPLPIENRLGPALLQLANGLRLFAQRLESESDQIDFVSPADRLNLLAHELDTWLKQASDDSVYWIEGGWNRRSQARVALNAAPIDIGSVMREQLFQKTDSVIMTSATITTGRENSFDFFKRQIGLSDCNLNRQGSPFNYRKQAEIILVENMPDPQDQTNYELATAQAVKRYVSRTDGHAFVLFTSYRMLKRVCQLMQSWMIEQGLAIYSQGEGSPRGKLLEQFKALPRGVLFGTESFWQGVDVPGDALRNVIITKLPFSVPDHPLLEAKLEAIRKRGGNPFSDYQIPEAIIKLRQGIGRLIRTKTDQGIIVLLDPRIISKPYGAQFLQALPHAPIVRERIDY